MVSSPSEIPSQAPGNIILNAQLFAAPGKADAVEKHLLAIQKNALSSAEPGCLEYRPSRSFVTEGTVVFGVWEKYTGEQAINVHMASSPFQAMIAEGKDIFSAPPDIKYYYELSS